MGWSCTFFANDTMQIIRDSIRENSWIGNNGKEYFFEIGRENIDGGITGSVFRIYDGIHAKRVGNFRIEPDGTLTRFPYLPKDIKKKIAEHGRDTNFW